MRLGFHYHVPFSRNEDGDVTVPGYLGRFLDSLAGCVDELVCFMHSATPSEVQYSDYRLRAINLRWVDIGPHSSIPKRTLTAHRYMQLVRQERRNLDAILIRGPSPLLPEVAAAVGRLPVALLLVGDYLDGIDDLPQPQWRKEAIRLWSYVNYRRQMAVAKRSLTFVNSRKLYEQFQLHVPDLVETRTTTLSVSDFYERDDTCQSVPIRLLYTGRIDRAKGLFEMVEAVDILLKQGHDVVLDLVGWPAKGDTIVEELLRNVIRRSLEGRIVFRGFKSVGPELFAYYKQADIYLIASQNSEGFPRTIWEAMAHSVPVVATRVGSIPFYLEHELNALLINPRDILNLAQGVNRLIQDRALRQRVIYNARTLTQENTLENRAMEIISALNIWRGNPVVKEN